jgi:alginate O-acetyltransferase complex protein AlgI
VSFTSQVFLLFCLLFYPVYFLSKGTRLNNYVIVVASCIFYGWWDWRFVILFGITTCFDFAAARLIGGEQNQQRRLTLVWASMAANLLMLGFFKYSNFLFANLNILFEPAGVSLGNWYLAVILPAGISFYTFQSMSYTIDVYRRKIAPSNSLIEFLAYVSFFPHMIAGPIQRSTHFLPQFRTERTFNIETATDGLRQIVWGLIKKVVIADNLAPLVEAVFEHPADAHGPQVLIGTVFFSFQIYCDFSGYSDIAIGLAKVMGFDLSRNFAYPYFSTSIQEFWRRWHISLTSWFREYVYQPLGGNHTTRAKWIRNVALVFLLSGIWRGMGGDPRRGILGFCPVL